MNEVWIVKTGMITSAGGCSEQVVSSFQAGLTCYQESTIYNSYFHPMTLALVPEEALPKMSPEVSETSCLTSRKSRMLRLADAALREASEEFEGLATTPLFMAGPEPLFGRPSPMDEDFLDLLGRQTGLEFQRKQSAVFPNGRAGVVHALNAATQYLISGRGAFALIGGVDTHLDLFVLGQLDSEGRVLAEGVMDGFAPGEGACFLLITGDPANPAVSCLAKICLPPGLESEPGHRYTDEEYKGEALAAAARTAIGASGGELIDAVFSSSNGESLTAKETGIAVMRNQIEFVEGFTLHYPAECFGDTGGAASSLILGLGANVFGAGGRTLVLASSELEDRGAICLSSNAAKK